MITFGCEAAIDAAEKAEATASNTHFGQPDGHRPHF
jgi:hypothetical protein